MTTRSQAQAEQSPAAEAGRLPAAAHMGSVHVGVTDGSRALEYYRDAVGLRVMEQTGDLVRLGAGDRELVVLHPGSMGAVVPHHTGLYHLALLVPNRRELARVIGRLGQLGVDNYPTDHVLTKSTYLWDPDGNGIEVYCESPEDGTWYMTAETFEARDTQGRVRSGRDPMDLAEMFSHLEDGDRLDAPLPDETRMGHVHLHVRDVEEAVGFYRDVVGFDLQGLAARVGMAFVSAGGYHHHLGLNSWAGRGVSPAPEGTAGLRHFTIEVPSRDDVGAVAARLEAAGANLGEGPDGHWAEDPSRNRFRLIVRAG